MTRRAADERMLLALERERRPRAVTPDGYTANQMKRLAIHEIETAGGIAWIANVGAARIDGRFVRFGVPGMGDVCGVLPNGRFISVEVKTMNDRLTPEQNEWLWRVRARGGVAIVAETLDDIRAALGEALSRSSP